MYHPRRISHRKPRLVQMGYPVITVTEYVYGVSHRSHVLFAAYHKARPSRAINEDVYYYGSPGQQACGRRRQLYFCLRLSRTALCTVVWRTYAVRTRGAL